MFEDIEEFGYERDLVIDDELVNELPAQNIYSPGRPSPERFFPTDDDLNDEEQQIETYRPKRFKPVLNDDPSALDWYLRINLDDDCEKISGNSRENEKIITDTIKRVQQFKSGVGLSGEKSKSNDFSLTNNVRIFKFPPRNSIYWTAITSLQGVRYYILTKPERNSSISERRFDSSTNLIENFSEILYEAEKMNERKSCEFDEEPMTETFTIERLLLVDKYKARYYTDLLSDDGINRTLLTWLKLWDECVFKIVKPKLSPKIVANTKQSFNKFRRKQPDADDLLSELDQYRRPQYKIVLLCGPPGVGKTTLTHICARLCGYFVHEMNASDDRTLDAFRKQLENATQMTATLDGGSKPHCLIIDEIDGAPTPTIEYLVNLVKTDGPNDATAKKPNKQIVRRPIICICNDLYVPALKELRRTALVLHVPPIEPRRLSERLSLIAKFENISANPSVFETLCDKADYDVRSCINTLQFLSVHSRGKPITSSDLSHSDVGVKDLHKSLFTVWRDIFTLPKLKRKRHQEDPFEIVNPTSVHSRFKNILKIVEECGETDRVVDGLFENYLNISFKDPKMDLTVHCLNWLQTVDQLDRLVAESQCYEFWGYKRYLPVLFHLLFATSFSYPKISFPQMVADAHFKTIKNTSVLQSLMNEMQPIVVAGGCLTVLIHDVYPFLLNIIHPDLRPVNAQLYSDKERADLKNLVKIMSDYNLTYRQERKADGHYDFVLEPPIDEIVKFSSLKVNRKHMSYVAKQLIAREIEIAKVKCAEPKIITTQKTKLPQLTTAVLQPKTFAEREVKIYFHRIGEDKTKTANGDRGKTENRPKLWFRFNEGSSNAIRRNVKVADMV